MKTAKPARKVPAVVSRNSWSHALAKSLPVLLGQGLIYVYVINGLGAEPVIGAIIGLMLLAPVIVALVHASNQDPSRGPARAKGAALPKPLRLR